MKPCFDRLPTISLTTRWRVSLLSVMVPGNLMWCSEHPTFMVGAFKASPSLSATESANVSPSMVSVDTGRHGPCCSLLPTANTTVVYPFSMAAPISGDVIWARSIISLKVGAD